MTSPDATPPTVADRLAAAGVSAERVEQHLAAGRIRLNGERADDLATPAARITLAGS